MESLTPRAPGDAKHLTRRQVLRLATAAGVGAAVTASGCTPPSNPQAPSSPDVPTMPPPSAASGLPPVQVAPQIPTGATSSAPLLCRDAWGATAAHAGGIPHTLSRMTIHHTAVTLGDNSNAPARLRQHQRYHQDSHGWIDIAYHIGVDRNGNIFELRRPEFVGDTATNYDPRGHFLVVCEGNFDEEQVTEAQLNGAAFAFAWAAQRFAIPTTTLGGHRDATPETACPGANLYAHVSSGDLKQRIDDLTARGAVDLHPICGAEASAVVADIEAGLR